MRRFKQLEHPIGVGQVTVEDEFVAMVQYRLDVLQEIEVIETSTSTDESVGHIRIKGQVIVLEGERILTGKNDLILHLKDGRRLPFWAKSGIPVNAVFEIRASPGARDMFEIKGL